MIDLFMLYYILLQFVGPLSWFVQGSEWGFGFLSSHLDRMKWKKATSPVEATCGHGLLLVRQRDQCRKRRVLPHLRLLDLLVSVRAVRGYELPSRSALRPEQAVPVSCQATR